jgi:thiol-disulfide isomerase/thioredoxin
VAVWAASWFASWFAARRASGVAAKQPDAGSEVVSAALLGLLAARLAHLTLQADLYLPSPWSALDLRDGGWHASTGVAASAVWLVWRGLRRPALRRALAAGVLAGVALWFAGSVATGRFDAAVMPAVTLIALNGGGAADIRQAARGRPVVVNLWASWCGPCRQEMPVLAAAEQREGAIGFLFVNQGESNTAVRTYLDAQRLPLREVWLDRESRLGPAVGSRGLPTTLFYDAEGRQVDAHFGALSAVALESRLRALRAVP